MESEEHFQCLKVMNSDNQSLLKHYITWRIKMKSTDYHIATQLGNSKDYLEIGKTLKYS